MRRFIFKCALLLVLVTGLILLVNALYVRTNYWKSDSDMNKFSDIPYNLELGNVGSSHTKVGIDWRVTPEVNAWNLALDEQRFFYDYAVLNKFIDHFAENAVILICLSYFEIDNFLSSSDHTRARYYRILSKEDMDTWSLKEYVFYKLVPVLSADDVKMTGLLFDKPVSHMNPYYYRNSYMEGDRLYEYCIKKHSGWTTRLRPTTPQEDYAENLAKVSEMIELCESHHLRPVLITTPITDVLNSIYDEKTPDFFATFHQFSADLRERYPDVPYFDYSHDEAFSGRHELFADGDHLNNAGAELFTKTLVADLQKEGFLPSHTKSSD